MAVAEKLKIGIIGGGAVGLPYACLLADVADILIIAHGKTQAESIRSNGLRLTRSNKTTDIQGVDASADMASLASRDVVIVAVKSYDTESIAKELAEVLHDDTPVVSLQNGLQAYDLLERVLPNPDRVFAGITYVGARRVDGHSVSLGQFTRTVLDAKLVGLVEVLQAAGCQVEASTNIRQAMWDKMVLNNGQNALSAVTDMSVRQMLASESCLEIASHLLDEFAEVAHAEGLTFDGSLMNKLKANWGGGDDFHPSMWQDLQAGKRTEIDAINGAVS